MPDLTTLAALKLWDNRFASNSTSADAILSSIITATSADFIRAIERTDLMSATYTEQRVGDGSCRLIMRHWPITAVATVNISGTAIPGTNFYFDETLDPERTFVLYMTPGTVYTDAAPIVVAYTAGYETVPADIAQAVNEWCALRYHKKQVAGQKQLRDLEGERTDIDDAAAPGTTLRVIENYKRKWPGYGRLNDPASSGSGGQGPFQRRQSNAGAQPGGSR